MKKKTNNGFTIIELLITLALLAILVTMAVNMTRTAVARADFTNTLNQFVADFSYARQLASRTNRYVAIVFDNAGTSYSIMTQNKTGDYDNFTVNKTVEPMMGKDFFDPGNTPSFTVNSMGMIRDYPIDANSPLRSVELEFFQKKTDDVFLYKRKVQIYSTGGIKIQKNTFNYGSQ